MNFTPLEDLPQPIKDEILRKANGEEYKNKPHTYAVTELLYCLRKAYFKRTNPKPLSLKQAFNIYRGKIFDQLWTPLFRHNQVRCTYRLKNVPITISGKYDFLTEEGKVTDLKTAKTLFYINEPSSEYIKQVRFYGYCNALEKAQILYIDFGDCKLFPVEVGDCTQLLQELEEKATLLFWALQKGKAPEKTSVETWMCENCEYQEECN